MSHSVHLYGGPLDGHTEPNVPEHAHALTWASLDGAVYTYCPHATAAFTQQRGTPVTVFISCDVEHDAFDPSLRHNSEPRTENEEPN
jgi:hypothetical protein